MKTLAEIYELNLTMKKVMRTDAEKALRENVVDNIIAQVKILELDPQITFLLEDSKAQEESSELTDLQVKDLEYYIDRHDLDLCYISAYPGGFSCGDVALDSKQFVNFEAQMQNFLDDVKHIAIFDGIIDIRSENVDESVVYLVKDSVLTAHEGYAYEAS
jgi:hypothetical protein